MEKDPIQLQEELSESDGSSSNDSSNDGYCSDNEIQSKTKGKPSKHSQGGGSKKTHRNQSNVFSDDECVSEVERKSNPNKNSSSGKHQKEELRQGNTVTLRKTQRNNPEAEKDSKKKDPAVKRQLVEQADCSSVRQKSRPIAENEQRSRSPHKKAVEVESAWWKAKGIPCIFRQISPHNSYLTQVQAIQCSNQQFSSRTEIGK